MDGELDGGLPLHGLHALQVASQQCGAVLDRRSGEDGRGEDRKRKESKEKRPGRGRSGWMGTGREEE